MPSLEREIRRELTQRSEGHAVEVFARNLRSKLLAPPLRGRRVLAVDPGFRTGCKLAVLDETGNLLEDGVIYPHTRRRRAGRGQGPAGRVGAQASGPGHRHRQRHRLPRDRGSRLRADRRPGRPAPRQAAGSRSAEPSRAPNPPLRRQPLKPSPAAAAGSRSRAGSRGRRRRACSPEAAAPRARRDAAAAPAAPERDAAAAQPRRRRRRAAAPATPPPPPPNPLLGLPDAPADLAYVIVNEAGASVYSASPVGREEFPNFDATLRGTISIGRRLQDPLSELVKIDPQHVGVGLYQHDVSPKQLRESLDGVVESCVNTVGVDLNTASVPLLRHVSGLNQLVARDLVEYRKNERPVPEPRAADAGARHRRRRASCRRPASSRSAAATTRSTAPGFTRKAIPIARQVLTDLGFTPEDLLDKQTARRAAREAERGFAGRDGRTAASRRADGRRHPRRPGPARPRPARGSAAADLQEGHPQARRPCSRAWS